MARVAASLSGLDKPTYGVRSQDGYVRNFRSLGALPAVWHKATEFGTAQDVTRRFRDIVFYASRDDNAPAQILKWFRYGFLNRKTTLVLGKKLGATAAMLSHIRAFEEAGVSYLFYRFIKQVDLTHARAVFYPYNTMWNPGLVQIRGPQHVFLGHGESDKAASIAPLIRIYDRIFVSGDLAISRLMHARVINECDLRSGRVVRVGMPYLPEAPTRSEDAQGYVLYAPTWEGMDGQQYSSLQVGAGKALLRCVLESTKHDVVFRPHPSTGIRDARYRSYVADIIATFGRSDRFHVHVDTHEQQAVSAREMPRTRLSRQCTVDDSIAGASWVFADVSSIVSATVQASKPYVLLTTADGAHGALSSGAARILTLQEVSGFPVQALLDDRAAYLEACSRVNEMRAACVSVEPYLRDVARADLLDVVLSSTERGDGGTAPGAEVSSAAVTG